MVQAYFNSPAYADGPSLRKLNTPRGSAGSASPSGSAGSSISLSESLHDVVQEHRAPNYPAVGEGSPTWYHTVDRLSRKITAQRHDLWDTQAKLRIEVEKNRDLAKIIQAERKEHREIVSALTAKISSLEQALANSIVSSSVTQSVPENKGPSSVDPPSRDRPASSDLSHKDSASETDLASVIKELTSKVDNLADENSELRKLILSSKATSGANPQHEHNSAPNAIQEPKPELDPESEHRDRADNASQNARRSKESPQIGINENQLRQIETLIADNERLSTELKQQSEENRTQRVRFDDLTGIVQLMLKAQAEATLAPTSRKDTNDLKPPQPHEEPATPVQVSMRTAPSPPTFRPDTRPRKSASSTRSSPRPLQQSSLSYEDTTATRNSVSTPSTSSASTPSLKLRPIHHHKGTNDPNIARLDQLRNRLEQGSIGNDELARYKDIYEFAPQLLAERPQLLADTKQLLHSLQHKAPLRHSPILAQLGEEAF